MKSLLVDDSEAITKCTLIALAQVAFTAYYRTWMHELFCFPSLIWDGTWECEDPLCLQPKEHQACCNAKTPDVWAINSVHLVAAHTCANADGLLELCFWNVLLGFGPKATPSLDKFPLPGWRKGGSVWGNDLWGCGREGIRIAVRGTAHSRLQNYNYLRGMCVTRCEVCVHACKK